MERYTLERGGVVLGVVTRGPWDGNQGSWHDWGWLEALEGFKELGRLLAEECRLLDEAVRLEVEGGNPSPALEEASRLQTEFMRPGVALVSFAGGQRLTLDEFHVETDRVYWR